MNEFKFPCPSTGISSNLSNKLLLFIHSLYFNLWWVSRQNGNPLLSSHFVASRLVNDHRKYVRGTFNQHFILFLPCGIGVWKLDTVAKAMAVGAICKKEVQQMFH